MDLPEKIKIIQTSSLFDKLSPEEAQKIAKIAKEKTISPRIVFIEQGEKSDVAYLICTGAVRVYRITEDGEEVSLAILGPGEIVGEMTLLGQEQRCANVESIQETKMLLIERGAFLRILHQSPEVSVKLLQTLCKRVSVIDEYLEEIVSKDLKDRVLKVLTILASYYPNGDIAMSHDELATLVCATRPRVTEVLGDLQNQGKIALAHRKIHLN